jgi:hypothetical protein
MDGRERRITRIPRFSVGPGAPSSRQIEENASGATKIQREHRNITNAFKELKISKLAEVYGEDLVRLGLAYKEAQHKPDGSNVMYRGELVEAEAVTEMFAEALYMGLTSQPESNQREWTKGLFSALRKLGR